MAKRDGNLSLISSTADGTPPLLREKVPSPIKVRVCNRSGQTLDKYDRDIVRRAVVDYLYDGSDTRLLVVAHKWCDTGHEHTVAQDVPESYSTLEVVEELRDSKYPSSRQIFWVCRLSSTYKTVQVLKVVRPSYFEPERAVERLASRVLESMGFSRKVSDMPRSEAASSAYLKGEESE